MDVLTPRDQWRQVYPSTFDGVMSCYSHELETLKIMPMKAGQIFHLADTGEFWMYLGEYKPEVPRWKVALKWTLYVFDVAVAAYLLWLLFQVF